MNLRLCQHIECGKRGLEFSIQALRAFQVRTGLFKGAMHEMIDTGIEGAYQLAELSETLSGSRTRFSG